ncbi:MAG: hypothetical protein KC613_01660 [Myxococcales bacterium]|nr:hypothetical protein [Myxococcales bacterium]MCB9525394.1 hypothetical protein [Myxococcales bacterium]
MSSDRRLRRSDRPQLASRYCLQSLTRRHRLSAMVLADDQGRLVAGAEGEPCGPGYLANRVADGYGRQLASIARETFETNARRDEDLTDRFGEPVRALPVHAGGRRFFLVTVGTPRDADAACVAASSALRRIFDPSNAPQPIAA